MVVQIQIFYGGKQCSSISYKEQTFFPAERLEINNFTPEIPPNTIKNIPRDESAWRSYRFD